MKNRIYNTKIKGIKENCIECRDGSKMISTGFLSKESLGNMWYIEYICKQCKEELLTWDSKYEPLIQEVLKEEEIIK